MGKIVHGIFGVQSMDVRVAHDEIMRVNLELIAEPGFDARQLYEYTEWNDMFPGNVVIPCQYCAQWGARKTACTHCGGAIE